jgi:Zn-dependent protease with chaperone function
VKRGLKYIPGLSSSSHPMRPEKIMNIPILYLRDSRHTVADARGFGKRAKIVVNEPIFAQLPHETQMAVLYHEAGHIVGGHREIRVFLLAMLCVPAVVLLSWPVLLCLGATLGLYLAVQRVAQDQELDADRFAAQQGYGREMLAFVRAAGAPSIPPFFYPDFERRVGALARFLQEKENGTIH